MADDWEVGTDIGASAFGTAPLGKPEPATPSRPSGRVSTDAAHTPGPWAVSKGCDQYVCTQGMWIAATMGIRGDEGAANAKLIAAAPELLDALEAIIADIDLSDHMTVEDRQRALAAIRKAGA